MWMYHRPATAPCIKLALAQHRLYLTLKVLVLTGLTWSAPRKVLCRRDTAMRTRYDVGPRSDRGDMRFTLAHTRECCLQRNSCYVRELCWYKVRARRLSQRRTVEKPTPQ